MKTVSAKITVALLITVMTLAVMPLSAFSLSQQQQEDIYRVDTLWQEEYPAKYIDFLLTSDNFVYHLDVTEGNIIQDITYESIDLNAYQKKENYKEILIAIIEHTHNSTNNLSKQEVAKEVQQEFMNSLEKHVLGFVTEGYETLEKICTALQNTSSQLLNQVYLPGTDAAQLYYTEIYQMIYSQIDDPTVQNQAREMLESYTGSQNWLKNAQKFSICLDMMNMGMNICQDYLDGIIELEALAKTNEKYVDLLQYIHGHTDDMALKAACFELSDKLSSSYDDNLKSVLYDAVADNAMESIGFATLKEAFSDANVYTKSIVYAIDAGVAVSKWLFNVGDIYSHMQTVYCVNVISELLVQQVRRDLADLHIYDQPTVKAAQRAADTIYHVKTLIGLRKIGEANYYALKNSVYHARLTQAVGALFWDLADKNLSSIDEWYTEFGKAMNIIESSLFQIIPTDNYYVPEVAPKFTVKDGVLIEYNGSLKDVYVTYDVISIASYAFQNATNMESVEIFDSVNTISSYAFCGCSHLKAVYIHRPDAAIDPNAFAECGEGMVIHGYEGSTAESYAYANDLAFVPFDTDYETTPDEINPDFVIENGVLIGYYGYSTDVYIPYGVTEIADEAFYGKGIYSVVLPDTVEKIGNYAFAGCSYLKEVYLPDSLMSLNDYAFAGCTFLEKENIRLPAAIKEMGINPFSGTPAHRAFLASSEQCFYLDGYLLESRDADGIGKTLTVKDGTLVIAEAALSNHSAYSTVCLPEGLKYIGNSAFAFSSVKYITVPNTVEFIGEYAFEYCRGLLEITLSDSMTELCDGVFYGCEYLQSVNLGQGIATVGYDAFKDCQALSTLAISKNFRELKDPFGLETVKRLILLEGVETVSRELLFSFDNCFVEEIVLPDGVISIADGAFANCSYLRAVNLPASLKTIGDRAFSDCENLLSISFSEGLESIGAEAFYQCFALSEVSIPASVKTIKDEAFIHCENLRRVLFSNGIGSIGQKSFRNTGITELYIPDSVTYIGQYAFSFCEELKTLVLDAQVAELDLGVFYQCTALENVTLSHCITSIDEFCFTACEAIKTVHFKGSCREWANIDFHYENNTLQEAPNLTVATHIGEWELITPPICTAPGVEQLICTFCGNVSTRDTAEWHLWDSEWTVDLPATCTADGSRSRHCANCDEKTDVQVIPAAHIWDSEWTVDIPATCTEIGSQSRHCLACDEKTDVISIPTSHTWSEEWTVDLLPTEAEEGIQSRHCLLCEARTDFLSIPKLGTPSPAEDFSYFEENGEIVISGYLGTNPIMSIPSHIDGKPVTKIASFAFSKNTVITTAILPYTLKEIEYYAFTKCANLEKAVLSGTVTAISESAFSNCEKLTEVIFPNTLSSIGEWAFYNCTSLVSLTLPERLQTIGSYAFYGCSALENVCIGSHLTKVEASAFGYRGVLTDVYYHGTEAEWEAVEVAASGNDLLLNATMHFSTHTHTYGEYLPCGENAHRVTCDCGHFYEEPHLWQFKDCLSPLFCAGCGATQTTPAGHTFLHYVSDNNATYTEDGTKTAKCEHCAKTDTQPDLGTALGLDRKFKDELSDFTVGETVEVTYADLYALLQTYATLSFEQKEAVAEEFAVLQKAIEAYNEQVDALNGEVQNASRLAFVPAVGTSTALLAGLWFLLRKKFLG